MTQRLMSSADDTIAPAGCIVVERTLSEGLELAFLHHARRDDVSRAIDFADASLAVAHVERPKEASL